MFFITRTFLQLIEDFGYGKFFLCFIGIVIVAYIIGRIRSERFYRRRINADKVCPINHNAIKSAEQIGKFLKQRRGLSEGSFDSKDINRRIKVEYGMYPALVHFIRVCHLHGCEVEIRQVTEERTSVHKTDDELITFMRPKFYEEQEYVV